MRQMHTTTIPKFLLQQARRHNGKHKRIGVYAGAFNPVHSGHIAFALQAIETAALDEVVFLPERRPRHKTGTEHFGHRMAMLTRAIKPHPKLSVAELVDTKFTVNRTLPQLRVLFPNATLVFLVGSDVALHVPQWDNAGQLLQESELFIGLRAGQSCEAVTAEIEGWPQQPRAHNVVSSYAPEVSSSQVREAIRQRHTRAGVLASVAQYARQNWLYVALP